MDMGLGATSGQLAAVGQHLTGASQVQAGRNACVHTVRAASLHRTVMQVASTNHLLSFTLPFLARKHNVAHDYTESPEAHSRVASYYSFDFKLRSSSGLELGNGTPFMLHTLA